MWGHLIRLVTPLAWDVVRDRLFPERRVPAPPPAPHTDLESRLLRLETRVDTVTETVAKQADELARVLEVIGTRVTVALWLASASLVTSVITLVVVLVRA